MGGTSGVRGMGRRGEGAVVPLPPPPSSRSGSGYVLPRPPPRNVSPPRKKHHHHEDFMKQWSQAVVRTLPAPPGMRPKAAVRPLPAPPHAGHDTRVAPPAVTGNGKRTRRGIDRRRAAKISKKEKEGKEEKRRRDFEVVVIESDSGSSEEDNREWSGEDTSTSEPSDPRRARGVLRSTPGFGVGGKAISRDNARRGETTEARAGAGFKIPEIAAAKLPPLTFHPQKPTHVNGVPNPGKLWNVSRKEKEQPRAGAGFARENTAKKIAHLLERRKLRLVLDLDHTVLNSATFEDCASSNSGNLLQHRVNAEAADSGKEKKTLHKLNELGLWTKTRPGVELFLKKASALFEIHICTAGSQAYAEKMRCILDSGRDLVKGSVVGLASFDKFGAPRPGDVVKTMTNELAGSEQIAIVLDDTPHVWPGHAENLIVCERYVYFPSCARRFGTLTPSLLELRVDESAERGMLATAFDVLQRVHSDFFARRAAAIAFTRKRARELDAVGVSGGVVLALDDESSDEEGELKSQKTPLEKEKNTQLCVPITVPQLLTLEKKRVLHGTELVFSGVVPSNTDPSTHPLWRLAEAFGAKCVRAQRNDTTTHVVVEPANLGPGGTDKMIWAFGKNIHVVTPGWVLTSAASFQRADEEAFTVRR